MKSLGLTDQAIKAGYSKTSILILGYLSGVN